MANLIQVNENYSIGSDENQWIVYKHVPVTKHKPSGMVAISFHGTLVSAVKSLSNLMLRLSNATSVSELQQAAAGINRLMNETFNLEKIT